MIDTVPTIYGPVAVFDTDYAQYPWLVKTGAPVEDQYMEVVRDLLKERPRGTMLDVGACYGVWSLALAEVVDNIIAFEPQPAIFDLLVRNFVANLPLGKALMINSAAWNQPTTLRLPVIDYEQSGNFGGTALGFRDRGIPVDARPVDDLVPKDSHVSFIKIDVEGAERQVLLGATETIRRSKPIMFIEYDHANTHKEGLRRQIDAMSYTTEEWQGNFLCVPLGVS